MGEVNWHESDSCVQASVPQHLNSRLPDRRSRASFRRFQSRALPIRLAEHAQSANGALSRTRRLGFRHQLACLRNEIADLERLHQEWNLVLLEEAADFRFGE